MHIYAKERDKKERQERRAKKQKGIEAQRAKPPTSTRVADALIGDEEHNKKKENGKRKNHEGTTPTYPKLFTYTNFYPDVS